MSTATTKLTDVWTAMSARAIRPLSLVAMACVILTVSAIAAAFCVVHERANARDVATVVSIVWAVTAITPFAAAFEAGKHIAAMNKLPIWFVGISSAGFALLTSLFLSAVLTGQAGAQELSAQVVDRLPAAILVTIMLSVAGSLLRSSGDEVRSEKNNVSEKNNINALPMPHEQILYVTSAGNYVHVHAIGQTALIRSKISDVERILSRARFARIHRSTIINLAKVRRVELENGARIAIMENGVRLRASRARAHALNKLGVSL